MVPKDQQGKKLEPLNMLKSTMPNIYTEKVRKYVGREHVMQRHVPPLDCLWNDVLHLSPIDPKVLIESLREAGMKERSFDFYKIDPAVLNQKLTCVYLYKSLDKIKQPDESEFVPFNPESLEEWQEVPEVTKKYFKDRFDAGEKPLMFVAIPHILYRGTIDVSETEIVSVS